MDDTAIQTWDETRRSIELLFNGASPDGDIFELICANLSIVVLVTGFESYCKRRFLELEDEGVESNFEELAKKFLPKLERTDLSKIITERAHINGISPTKQLVNEDRINFQNYDNCKTAFYKAYGLSFGNDLQISSTLIEELKNIIQYRHKIVHISPLKAIPTTDTAGKKIMPSKDYVIKSMNTMNKFIHELHNTTLALHPKK